MIDGSEIRNFWVHRVEDESGVSGTGLVIEGSEFTTGKVVISWLGNFPYSVAVYDSYEAFEEIHIKSHPENKTKVVWSDGQIKEYG